MRVLKQWRRKSHSLRPEALVKYQLDSRITPLHELCMPFLKLKRKLKQYEALRKTLVLTCIFNVWGYMEILLYQPLESQATFVNFLLSFRCNVAESVVCLFWWNSWRVFYYKICQLKIKERKEKKICWRMRFCYGDLEKSLKDTIGNIKQGHSYVEKLAVHFRLWCKIVF